MICCFVLLVSGGSFVVVFEVAVTMVSTAVAKSLVHIHLSRFCKGTSSPSRYLPGLNDKPVTLVKPILKQKMSQQ